MKYIRTKDGRIIDLTHWTQIPMMCVDKENNLTEEDICYQIQWLEKVGNGDACYIRSESISHNSQVLKQADTIKELCDKWVLIDRTGFCEPYICDSYRESKELKDSNDDLIGAIYTDKGLVYVAKMNDKGELELL